MNEVLAVLFVLAVAALAYGLGYKAGWRDCIRAHERTVTSVEGGSTITITSGDGGIRPGDRLWFHR